MNISSIFNLENQVAVLTGANKGIGKDMAIVLAEAGANVALIAREEKSLEETASIIRKKGKKALPVSLDLTHTEKIKDRVHDIYKHFGKIDILINNAGMNITKPPEEVTESDWDNVMDLNVKSSFFMAKAVGKYMKAQKKGKIINISSQMAFVGYYNRVPYCSSKGAVTQLTKSLAIEWAADKINVNAIAPTFIETPMTKSMFENKAFAKEVLDRIPLGRLPNLRIYMEHCCFWHHLHPI